MDLSSRFIQNKTWLLQNDNNRIEKKLSSCTCVCRIEGALLAEEDCVADKSGTQKKLNSGSLNLENINIIE